MNPATAFSIIVFSVLIRIILCSVNPKFQACEPKTCGNGPNISYPFHLVGRQDPFCGFPRFDLICAPNGFPSLNLSNTLYIVGEIFYRNNSLRVSNPKLQSSNSNNCLSPSNNLTLYGDRFDFAPNQTQLLLFFNCDTSSLPDDMRENRVGCSEGNRTRSVLGLAVDDDEEKLKYAKDNCRGGEVMTTVVENVERGIGEALGRGFMLTLANWTASRCDECKRSGGRCGFEFEGYRFRCYCPDGDNYLMCPSDHKRMRFMLVLGLGLVLPFAIIMLFLANCCFKRKLFRTRNHPSHQIIEDFLKEQGPLPSTRYSYSEIKKITNNFKFRLGQGGFGSVYKGSLRDGRFVAVKVLSELKGTGKEFINEVASISKTSHVNIVNLLGFCFQGSKRALVYEFMVNGSLEKFIFEANENMVVCQLNCKTLFNIAIGVARGLEYLHRGCNTRIVHFDIKPHNILLDEDFSPKISDFGLAKVCLRKESIVSLLDARGTIGYIAPELLSRNIGEVSHKSDVYSYGMMVLEMIGGSKNTNVKVECSSEIYFPHWIYRRLELNEELGLRWIENDANKEITRKMIVVSLWCIQTNPSSRPTISKVVEMLEGSLEALQVPPKPYMSSPSMSPVHYTTQTCETLELQ